MPKQKLEINSHPEIENTHQNIDDYIIDQEGFLPGESGLFENSGLYETLFVCLLAPRFEEHTLIGDLPDNLQTWMRDICISFGWNLKLIEISPNYLHWIIKVSIHTSPPGFMKIIQDTTSKKIFDEFPRFSKQNTSRKFWAPYYYVGIGDEPFSKPVIQSFIDQIRMEQGLF